MPQSSGPTSVRLGLRPQTFSGGAKENVNFWIVQLESLFNVAKVPEESRFTHTMFALQGDAQTFVVYLLKRMEVGKEVMTWDLFKKVLTARYNRQGIQSDLLRQELETMGYEGVRRMVEYITAFREIENQIYEMEFDDRLHIFVHPLPTDCTMFIRTMPGIATKDMEVVYQAARSWAHILLTSQPTSHSSHSAAPTLYKVRKVKSSKTHRGERSTPSSAAASGMSTTQELDMINRMDEAQAVCYTYGKKGHFARNCLDKDKGKGAVRGGRTSSSKMKSAYLRTEDKEESEESEESEEDFLVIEPVYESPHGYVEDLLDETPYERNYRDEHDRYYVMQTLSDSEEEEEAKEALLGMKLYKLSTDGMEAIKSSNPSSARLPIYGCDFKTETFGKVSLTLAPPPSMSMTNSSRN